MKTVALHRHAKRVINWVNRAAGRGELSPSDLRTVHFTNGLADAVDGHRWHIADMTELLAYEGDDWENLYDLVDGQFVVSTKGKSSDMVLEEPEEDRIRTLELFAGEGFFEKPNVYFTVKAKQLKDMLTGLDGTVTIGILVDEDLKIETLTPVHVQGSIVDSTQTGLFHTWVYGLLITAGTIKDRWVPKLFT